MTKSGSSSWNPGYNAKNQYANIPATYDADGHLTYDTFSYYSWDSYGELAATNPGTCGATASWCFTYDALGRVAEVVYESAIIQKVYGPTGYLSSSYSSLSEVDWTNLPVQGGSMVVMNCSAGNCHSYQHDDWIGTDRLASDVEGRTVSYDRAFAPYGEMYANFGSTTYYQTFSGMSTNRSSLIGLFDTPHREYAAPQGRWVSPDPAGSRWNLYAYGTDPNTQTDPSGLAIPGEGYLLPQMNFSDGGCTMDGVYAYCGEVSALLSSPAAGAIKCPNGDCSVFQKNYTSQTIGGSYRLVAGVNGPVWINNFNGAELSSAAAEEAGLDYPVGTLSDSTMRQILNQAKSRALTMLKNPTCKKAFGGIGALTMKLTSYPILPASAFNPPDAWAQQVNTYTVRLNSQGGFFTSMTGQVALQFGDPITLSYNMLQAFVLLHELSHQLSDITHALPDGDPSTGAAASEINNQFVYDTCVAH